LSAGFSRGDRLVAEGGGIAGVAGAGAPLDTPGLAGSAINEGIAGVPTVPGAPGILDYSDFYATMPADNSTAIPPGSAISFPNIGSTTGAITASSSSTFILPVIGTYAVQFQASVTEPAQLMLRLNGAELYDTVVGRSNVDTQIVGFSLVTTTSADSTLEVINPAEDATSLTLTPYAGNGNLSATAHLVIVRIQ
jgi:hypothetical protein